MELVFLTILLALVEYIVMAALVGRARAKYGISAPAMTGNPDFERANRVHINTLESLIVCVLTGNGLKDPTTAEAQAGAGAVIEAEPTVGSVSVALGW